MASWQKIVIGTCTLTALLLGGCSLPSEDVAQKAREITVQIEGCGEGSGAIYQRQGNTYLVLTAHHVVLQANLSCLIFTSDGKLHKADAPMIKPMPAVDLGILSFTSNNSYAVGQFGDSDEAVVGKTVYVAGAPQASEAIPTRTLIINDGKIVGRVSQPQDGYVLIYDALTRPGMSGGPVLNDRALIIGIHGRGDRNERGDKTGFNLGVPIQVFLTARGYTPKSVNILIPTWLWAVLSGSLVTAVLLASLRRQKHQPAIADYNKAIELNANDATAYNNDYNKAIELNANDATAYNNRGIAYYNQGEYQRAIADYNKAIELNPNDATAYHNRALVHNINGDIQQATRDFQKAADLFQQQGNQELYQDALNRLKELR